MGIDEITKGACVAPILYIDDIEASFAYYVDRLKFVKAWDGGIPSVLALFILAM